jgi:hypothetical protein
LFGLTDATFAMRGFSSSRGIRAKKQSSTPQPGLEANSEVVMALGAGSLTGFRWWVALQAEFCFYQSNDYAKIMAVVTPNMSIPLAASMGSSSLHRADNTVLLSPSVV